MEKLFAHAAMALLCAPLLAHAQAYRCKQPNGAMSFQDQPCAAGAASSTLTLPPPPTQQQINAARDGAQRRAQAEADGRTDARNKEIEARNRETEAYNKALRCNRARQQLGVAKMERPVFTRDNAGQRQYVDDKDRAAVIAEQERIVAAECQ
jgi:hypothetical protein